MAILYDDDFSSYSVGQNPPYGNTRHSGLFTTNAVIVNNITGIFGDNNSVNLPFAAEMQYPNTPMLTLADIAAGISYPSLGFQSFDQLSVFVGLKFNNTENQGFAVAEFQWARDNLNGQILGSIQVMSDGTIGIFAGQTLSAVSDFSLLTNKWYWMQVNISFFTASVPDVPTGSHTVVAFTTEVAVNNISVISGSFVTTVRMTSFGVFAPFCNTVVLGGFGINSGYIGRLTIYDTIQAIADNPHNGTPVAKVSQGVIELVELAKPSGPVSYARMGKAGFGLSYRDAN